MKKLFIGIVLSTLFVAANAQVSFGPKVGLNVSMATTNAANVVINPITPFFNAGAFFNYKFANQFAGQIELFYSGEGTKFKNKGNPTVYTDNISYLNIPLLFQLVTAGGFYVQTGPQMGFLLSATSSTNGISTDIKSSLNSTKFSWDIGIGTEISHKLGIDLRYAAGLSNINNGSTNTFKDNVLSIGLFYAFHPMSKTSTK